MQLYLSIFATAFLSAYSELKDVNRGRINKLHFTRNKISHGSKKVGSLLLDDTTTVPTDPSVNTTATTLAPEEDGAQLLWTTSDWSECSVDCGIGDRERIVNCFNNDTQTIQPDDLCIADQFVIPSVKPDTAEDCDGACLTCTDHTDLFVSIGLSSAPTQPVPNRETTVCKVADPKYSCCDNRVEDTIVTQVISIQQGFNSIPPAASSEVNSTMAFIANSTADFTQRLTETSAQLSEIETILAQSTSLKMDKKIFRALTVVQQVLTQRVLDLNQAVLNSTAIASLIQSQLGVLMTDTSMTDAELSTGNMSSSTLGQAATLSDCVDATVGLFASLSCAACNPSFVTDNVVQGNGTTGVQVSANMCAAVFKQCSPTIRNSRKYLRQALSVMRSLHSNLAKSAVRLQPALMELWSTLTFDWLPASNRPLSSYASSTNATFVPDISSLDCITNANAFVLPPATQMNDFCDNFFANWNYQFTIQNMLKDVKRGTRTFGVLNRCDKCLHTIAMKISQILADSKGGLDVTLALSPEALAEAGCVGLSSTPAQTPNSGISAVKQALLGGSMNFFAIGESDHAAWTSGELGQMHRKSKRAIALLLAPLDSADSAQLGLQNPTPFIQRISYTDSGFDPSVLANVSWSIINNATQNPPPSAWDVRWSSEVGVIASDMNCTSHTSCNPEAGDTPFWFCANQGVCNGTIPCDPNEQMLLQAHPRCVKGLCVDDSTAVDNKCPDIAICPTTTMGQFDHTYFSKFKNIAPQLPPSDELVNSEGPEMAAAISQALVYSAGVCDCAFAKKTDAAGYTTLVVGDTCAYAQCIAYAQFNENSLNCASGLNSVCLSYVTSCPNLVCDKVGAQWNVPTCDTNTTSSGGLGNGFALASDVKGAVMSSVNFLLLVFLII